MDKKLKYFDLMEDLRRQILSGEIKPGEKLPSENQLSAEYDVSRQTVRKALQILQNEGNGYSILLKNTRNSRSLEAKCLEELLKKDIDGLIIEPSKSRIFCRHINLYQMLDE